jgi:hypothetical protein
MNKLERNDLLRFYDHFISPRSPSRRKLALHVNPSPLAFKTPSDDKHKLPAETELSPTVIEGDTKSELSTSENKLNEQRPIIDQEIKTDIKDLQKTTLEIENKKYEELHLPKVIILSIHFFIIVFNFID